MPAIITCLKTPLAGVKQPGRDAKHSSPFSETTSDISMCERQIKDATLAPEVHVAVSSVHNQVAGNAARTEK
jgi:hypothetical protein